MRKHKNKERKDCTQKKTKKVLAILHSLGYLTSLCANDIIISTCKTKGGFPIYRGETVFFYSFLQVRYFSYHAVR